jgi:hypothetical protein
MNVLMKGIIDRFEGDYAVIELDDKKNIEVEKKLLPSNAKESDVLIIDGNIEYGKIIIDNLHIRSREQVIDELMDELFE